MAGVDSLAPRLVLIEVDESDFRSELEVCNLVGDGGPMTTIFLLLFIVFDNPLLWLCEKNLFRLSS